MRRALPKPLAWTLAASGLVLLFVNAPLILAVLASFGNGGILQFPPAGWSGRWYNQLFGDPSWLASIWNSFLIGAGTALVCVVLGTMAALGLARMRPRAADGMLAMLLTPMIIPHVVLAIGLFPVLAKLHLLNTRIGVVLGHTAVAVPLTVIVVLAALHGVDRRVEHAAASLGAPPWRVFREVTLPLIAPGVIGGGLLAFTLSFDELEISLFVSGPSARTFPLMLWQQVQFELTPLVAAASTVIALAVVAVLVIIATVRRRLAAGRSRLGVSPRPVPVGEEVAR